ncbi:MAG: insulinase family protein [Halobacteriovoraceae bacterium]|nr:insulinase family protein [Halobacteriovoraceae bacterium]
MKHEQIRLKNGLETLFIEAPGNTFASTQIWFRAGSALESNDNQGIAHFLEHMFFKGTPSRPGAAIAHDVESFGGEINAFTSFDYTCYYINSPVDRLNDSVNILMDMVSNPEFKNEDIIPERGVVFEEFRRSIDNPNQYSFSQIQNNSFTGGYSHQILGREDTIKNFNRGQLVEYRNKNYNLSNALLIVAGDLKEKSKIIESIECYEMPQGPSTFFPEFNLKKVAQYAIHEKDVEMMQLTLTIQAPDFSDNNAPSEDLAIACLGYGETSPLYTELVLKNTLANSASSSTMFMSKGGVHFLRVVFPAQNKDKIFKELYNLIKNTASNGLKKEDISKLKNQYISSKIYDKESLESFSFNLGHGFAQNGDINCDNEFIERVKKLSILKVNSSLKDIFSKPIHLSLQVPIGLNNKTLELKVKKLHESLNKIGKSLKSKKEKYQVKKSKFDSQVEVLELKKGISLFYRQNTMTPTFVLQIYAQGGLTEETPKSNGIYHLISTNLSKGHKFKKYEKLQMDLENMSATLNSFAGKNAYGMTLHGQSEDFESLTADFFNSFIFPTFPQKHINFEKKQTERQLLNQSKDPTRICFRKVNETLFQGHPYSLNILGNAANNKKIKIDDIKKLHFKNLKNKKIVICYCGNLDKEEIIPIIENSITTLKERTEKKSVKSIKVRPVTDKTYKIPFDREQTQIFYGIPAPALKNNDNLILKIITAHLSGQSSELFVDVRDKKGLCYTAQPIQFKALEAGYWGIYMASGYDKVEPATMAIKEIVTKIKNFGIPKKDFERVKTMLQGQTQINLQTNDDYASIYSIPLLQGLGLDYHHENLEYIKKLKYDDFQMRIKKIFSSKWNLYIVGRIDN